jgi:eukaryotic-like serine/threonine-protein kinase
VNIGPYEIICELGQGGMGVVYRALQPSLNRVIALKVLPVQLESDPTSVARFRQEAETAARLRHPNIVTVHEAAVDSPPYYIAMEFLEGRTLADLITSRGRLELSEAIALFKQICSALDHAHNKGIVHRDIKPSNIIVSDQGHAVLTDFGIARASDQTRLTRTGAVFGSPAYMSPEQVKGLRIDKRTDIYSAGALLFEMLTGRTPYDGDDSLAVMYRIVNEEPPSARTICPDIPPAVEAVIDHAMQKDPSSRFASCGEIALALENALRQPAEKEPTCITTDKTQEAPIPEAKSGATPAKGRHFLIFAAICILVLVGLTLLLFSDWKSGAKVESSASADSSAGSEQVSSIDGKVMVEVPAGEFLMGSVKGDSEAAADEYPQRRVYLDAFWIDKTEVTVGEYRKFCQTTGRSMPEAPEFGGQEDSSLVQENNPIVYVSWEDASAYAAWANKRLPTEAEWEKAARGTDGRKYPWGNTWDSERCNFISIDDGFRYASPVGSFPSGASPYGCLDMAGNVAEWCEDWYGETYYATGPSRNPTGPSSGQQRVLRGGDFLRIPEVGRCASRYHAGPGVVAFFYGFRCVSDDDSIGQK